MKRTYEIPLDQPFAVIWEYNGSIWSNTFVYVGQCEEGVKYFDPYNIESDTYDSERRSKAFFAEYPHKIFILDGED